MYSEYHIHKFLYNTLKGSIKYGLGDDSAILNISKKKSVLVTIDKTNVSTPKHTAKLAVIQNFSDIVCKGGKPTGLLISCQLPNTISAIKWFKEFICEVDILSQEYGAKLIGGDTKEASSIAIVTTALGLIKRKNFIPRLTAKNNDIIAVTLTRGKKVGWRWVHKLSEAGIINISKNESEYAKRRYYSDWEIPFREMLALSKSKIIRSSMDTSDGIEGCLIKMFGTLGYGAIINLKLIEKMVDPKIKNIATRLGIPLYMFALVPGYEWETVVSLKKEKLSLSQQIVKKTGGKLMPIGYVSKKTDGIILESDKKLIQLNPVVPEQFTGISFEQLCYKWINRSKEM